MPFKHSLVLGVLAASILAFQAGRSMGEGGVNSLEGMIRIEAGSYERGCADCRLADAAPVHAVKLSAFWIAETPVTNAQFRRFVEKTRYVTVAERELDPKNFPGIPKDKLRPGSAVFTPPANPISLTNPYAWWRYQPGASWKHPEGPGSDLKTRWDHPAVHISYEDAKAYCDWRGQRLPTEAEFEYAARGGLKNKKYSWGDELKPRGKWLANIWQGSFPDKNIKEDGYEGTSPVKAFPSNGYGLYDVSGNVWQWTSDWYRSDTYQTIAKKSAEIENPQGPASSYDSSEPGVVKRVQRGGSYLCSSEYCTRYLVAARGKGEPESSSSNVGFRCVKDDSSVKNSSPTPDGGRHENAATSKQIQAGAGSSRSGGGGGACHGRISRKKQFAGLREEAERPLYSSR
ncbi:MAG TPA: formylglycine-generating enzyme family protein [Bdellovibrionota bacterium]|jgi:formylglycine-generating enzyme required for sulfatase activity